MKSKRYATLAVLIAIGLGWYAGYSMAVAKANRAFRHMSGFSKGQWQALVQDVKALKEDQENANQGATLYALDALLQFSNGDDAKAKEILLRPMREFYREYGPTTNGSKMTTHRQRELLIRIERFASLNEPFRQSLTADKSTAQPSAGECDGGTRSTTVTFKTRP